MPATRALFDKARRSVPMESPWPARFGVAKSGDPTLIVEAKGLKPDTIRDVYFFPAEWGAVASMAKQTASVTRRGHPHPAEEGRRQGGDARAARRHAGADREDRRWRPCSRPSTCRPSSIRRSCRARVARRRRGSEQLSLVQALLFALLGGLILNLMPCVFPVLAMKAAAFARLAGHEQSAMRRDGLAYTAGVLVSFAAMAAVVVAIRASVGEVSWGFQFQSPIFSLLIAYLFFVVGLNLSGVFEIGGRFAGVGQGLTARGGTTGAFFTGVLAVIVATPCTAPFMAAALGFALSQPAPADRGRAAGDGPGPRPALSGARHDAGAAAPDAAARPVDGPAAPVPRLPDVCLGGLDDLGADPADRTGRRALCAGRHDPDRLRDLAAAAWPGSSLGTWLRRGVAAAAVLLAFAAALKLEDGPATAASASGGASAGVNFEGWERFSRARMTEAAAAGKPVFVDFTAAWCITCLVNERVALETPATPQGL